MKNLVLLHYFGGDSGSWKWFIDEMGATYKIKTLDLPGFGIEEPLKDYSIRNMASFVLDYIKREKLSKCTIIGHSMSGKIALKVGALDEGKWIENIILLAPSPPTIEKMTQAAKHKMLDQYNEERAIMNVEQGTYNVIRPMNFDYAVKSQLRVHTTAWKWWIKAGMSHSILDELNNLKIPLHLIYSEHDRAITKTSIEEDVIPHLKFKTIKQLAKVGHLVPIENPKLLADYIHTMKL